MVLNALQRQKMMIMVMMKDTNSYCYDEYGRVPGASHILSYLILAVSVLSGNAINPLLQSRTPTFKEV